MKLVSPVFEHQQKIPAKYTCKGENISPPLEFIDVPQNAKGLVLIVDDPDAPAGTWIHWIVFNIPISVSSIAENSKPEGTLGVTSFGKPGYGGPCPPSGTHRYFFKLYALDSTLDLSANADKKAVGEAMNGHIIEKAEMIGLFSKE